MANINFGILEKGSNKISTSMRFTKIEEAIYDYREPYGGNMNVIIDEQKTWDEKVRRYVSKVVGSYYVITVSDESFWI